MRRQGFTLHEMLISLGVMSVVIGLVAHAATEQFRFFRGVGEIVALRGQIGHAAIIATRLLWGVSPSAGDIAVAQDSAIQWHMRIGTAVTCDSALGRITMPAASAGNTLAAFFESPDVGDRVAALFEDSTGSTWLTFHVASPPSAGAGCAAFPSVTSTWTVPLRQQVVIPARAALRFERSLRLSLYRAGDGRWYLGAKDWNGATQAFNTIQPVAGPLRSYSSDPSSSGLLFTYRDEHGTMLAHPVDPLRIASVTVVARARSTRPVRVSGLMSLSNHAYEDSTAVTIGLRNSR